MCNTQYQIIYSGLLLPLKLKRINMAIYKLFLLVSILSKSEILVFSHSGSDSVMLSESIPASGGQIFYPVVLLTGGVVDTTDIKLDNSVEVFSPFENISCSRDLKNLPNPTRSHTINIFKNKIIMCGGYIPNTSVLVTLDKCFSLDENLSFVPHSQLKGFHAGHKAAVISDKLLLVGLLYSEAKSLEAWDGSQWVVEEDNLVENKDVQPDYSCMAAVSEDTFLMSGGRSSFEVNKGTNKMVKYKNGVWERMEDFPGPGRMDHGCAFIETPEGGAFLIAGGHSEPRIGDDQNYLGSSYLYNIEKKEWAEVGKLNFPRSDGQILEVNGRPIIVGGWWYSESGVKKMVEDVEEYNVETKQWTVIEKKIRGKVEFGAVVVPAASVGCSYIG